MVRDGARAFVNYSHAPLGARLLTMRREIRVAAPHRADATCSWRGRECWLRSALLMLSGRLSLLTLRSPPQAGVSKGEARTVASWFETALTRLLTMRVSSVPKT